MTTSAAPGASTTSAAAQTPGRRQKRETPTTAFDATFAAIAANVPMPASTHGPVTVLATDSHSTTKQVSVATAGEPVATMPDASTDAVASSIIRRGAPPTGPARAAPKAGADEMDTHAVPIRPCGAEPVAERDRPADIVPRDLAAALAVHNDTFALRAGNRIPESQPAAAASIVQTDARHAATGIARETLASTLPPVPSRTDKPSPAMPPTAPIATPPSASPKSVVVDHEPAVAGASRVPPDTTDVETRPGVEPSKPTSPRDSRASAGARAADADARSGIEASAQRAEPAVSKPASSARSELGRQRQFSLQAQASGAAAQGIDVEFASSVASPADAIATLVALGKAAAAVTGDSARRTLAVDADIDIDAGSGIGAVPWTGIGGSVSAPTASASAAPAAAFDETAWREAMARQVTAAAVAQTRETSVRLDAKGLGPIEVHVRVAAERVDVHFLIQRPVTADIVRDALPDLQRLLGQSGMTLGDASVAHQHAGRRGGEGASFRGADARGDVDDAPDIASMAPPRVRLGLLDHFA